MDLSALYTTIMTIIFTAAFYLTILLFIVGMVYRIQVWVKTPAPLPIPLTPAPKSVFGMLARVVGDFFLFQNLLKGTRLLWIGGWLFHLCLLGVFLRHLRYFLYPVPDWIMTVQTIGIYAGFLLPLPILYLFYRRVSITRTLYVSSMADYFILFLLLCIAGTGMLMHYYARPYLVDIKAFILGLITFAPVGLPSDPIFQIHFGLVLLLVAYFPFSKLVHGIGLLFNPVRTQIFDVRRRYVNPWNYPLNEAKILTNSEAKSGVTLQ